MRLALDTSAYSALQQGRARKLHSLVERAEELFLPFVVVAKLRAGFRRGAKTSENNRKLETFLGSDFADILYADADTINLYAEIWAELSRIGKPVPTNDIWIAALCLQHECQLLTDDGHFKQVPLLQTVGIS